MNAIGIDAAKGKSMMMALRPMNEVALKAREYPHTEVGLEQMALAILGLGGRHAGDHGGHRQVSRASGGSPA